MVGKSSSLGNENNSDVQNFLSWLHTIKKYSRSKKDGFFFFLP